MKFYLHLLALISAIAFNLFSMTKSDTTPTCSVIQGLPGLNGRDGRDGLKGEQGPQGLLGARGSIGPPGKMGPAGNPAMPGQKGEKGANGNTGPPGQKGEKGASGNTGLPAELAYVLQKLSVLENKVHTLQSSMAMQKKALLFARGTSSGNKIFVSHGKKANYEESQMLCERFGGQLATPMNSEENKAIQDLAQYYDASPLLGITDKKTEGTFRYKNGDVLRYSKWKKGEPNQEGEEDCVEMYLQSKDLGLWNDKSCGEARLNICEFSL